MNSNNLTHLLSPVDSTSHQKTTPISFCLMWVGLGLIVLLHLPVDPEILSNSLLGQLVNIGPFGSHLILTLIGYTSFSRLHDDQFNRQQLIKDSLVIYLSAIFFLCLFIAYQYKIGQSQNWNALINFFLFTHNYQPYLWQTYNFLEHYWLLAIFIQWNLIIFFISPLLKKYLNKLTLPFFMIAFGIGLWRIINYYFNDAIPNTLQAHTLPWKLDAFLWGAIIALKLELKYNKLLLFLILACASLGILFLYLQPFSHEQKVLQSSLSPIYIALFIFCFKNSSSQFALHQQSILKDRWWLWIFITHFSIKYHIIPPLATKLSLSYYTQVVTYFLLSTIVGIIIAEGVFFFLYRPFRYLLHHSSKS